MTDHVGNDGANNAQLHRIPKHFLLEDAKAAGFVVDGESDILAHAADDHSQDGVRSDAAREDRSVRRASAQAEVTCASRVARVCAEEAVAQVQIGVDNPLRTGENQQAAVRVNDAI